MQHNIDFYQLVKDLRPQIKEISVQDTVLLLEQDNTYLIDVREENEWIKGHAKQALHISKGIIERDIHLTFPNKEDKLILYCAGGFRSVLAAYNLQKMKYINVYSMIGGMAKWHDLEFPMVYPLLNT